MQFATPEGTARLRDRFLSRGAHPDAYRQLGRTGLIVGDVGFGGFRISDRIPDHTHALHDAWSFGVNLYDTAPTYGAGASERALGRAMAEWTRDEVVVLTKAGYVQGESLRRVSENVSRGRPYRGVFSISDDAQYCLDPRFLSDELAASAARLGLTCVDGFLLHNPETWLQFASGSPSERWAAFRERLHDAFAWAESMVAEGRFSWYGVCSNSLVASSDSDSDGIGLDVLVEIARAVGGDEHHFGLIEVPFNLLELEMAIPAGSSVIDTAAVAGLGVVTLRPLNAMGTRGLMRLADLELSSTPPRLDLARRELEGLEAEYAEGIGRALAGAGISSPDFRFSHDLVKRAADISEPVRFGEWVQGRLTTDLGNIVQNFETRLSPPMRAAFRFWLERYVDGLTMLSGALHAQNVALAGARTNRLRKTVEAWFRSEVSQSPTSAGLSTSQFALRSVLGVAGVSTVLVGMRRPEYVRDVADILRSPRGQLLVDPLVAGRAGEEPW